MKRLAILWLLLARIIFTSNAACSVSAGPGIGICDGVSDTLNAVVTGNSGAVTYAWTPATGLSATNIANPIATPTATTTYTVTLTGGGCTGVSANIKITVNPVPVAAFTPNSNNICSNFPISFTNSSSGAPGLSYQWNFGNSASGGSNTSTATNPSHTFVAPGNSSQTFTVQLTATSSDGCSASTSHNVTVNQSPDATLTDFVDNPPFTNCGNGNFALAADNTSSTTATNTEYNIDWGDGSSAFDTTTFLEATHTYTTLGFFNLVYMVTGQNGCVQTTDYVVFNGSNPAGGVVNPGGTTDLCPPFDLTFAITGTTNNPPGTLYIITINDGSAPDTIVQPPPATYSHTFTSTSCGASGGIIPNSYYVQMRIENPCGFTLSRIEPITISSLPVTLFTVSPDSVVCTNSPVTFTNTSVAAVTVDVNGNCLPSSKMNWIINPATGWTISSGALGNNPPTNNPATWGSTTLGINYTTPGTYNVSLITEAASAFACGEDTLTKTICVQSKPTASFALNQTIGCTPFAVNATDQTTNPNSCGFLKYFWKVNFVKDTCGNSGGGVSFTNGGSAPDSAANPSLQFDSSGVYQIIENVITGCGVSADTMTVTVKAKPKVTINPLPDTCGAGATINPTDTVTSCYGTVSAYSWTFTGGTPATSTSNPPGAITYVGQNTFTVGLGVTNECGTTNASGSFVVTPGPTANAGNDTTICSGKSVTLGGSPTATGGNGSYTYAWTPTSTLNDSTIANPVATPTITQSYILSVVSNSCRINDTINVTVDTLPVIAASLDSICAGQSATLIAGGATTYTWSPPTHLNTTTGDTVIANPASNVTYTITGTDGNGCSNTTTTLLRVYQLPLDNAGPDESYCNQNIPVMLTGTPIGGTWSGNGITAGGIFNPATAGIGAWPLVYSYVGTFGCVGTDTMIATVVAVTPANPGHGYPVCITTASVNLNTQNATPVGGAWSGRGVAGAIFTPSIAGLGPDDTLTYTFGTNTCLVSDTIIMTVEPQPTVTVNTDSICAGQSTTLIAGGATTYTWSPSTNLNAATGDTVMASPLSTATYTVTGTDVFGCTNTASSVLTVYQLPVVNAGPDQTYCNQSIPVTLIGLPAGGTWSGNGISAAGVFNPAAAGIGAWPLVYSYTGTFGCVGTDTMIATVIAVTPVNAGNGFPLCIYSAPVNLNTLGATPAGGTWSGNGVGGTTFVPSIAGVGSDTLTYTFGTGTCLVSDTVIMTVQPKPTVAVNSPTICNGQSAMLIGTGASTYSWSPATNLNTTTGDTVLANPSSSAIYTITGTSAGGCTNTATAVVTVDTLPTVSAGPDQSFCNQGLPVAITGTPAGGTWTGNNVSTNGIFNPAAAGIGNWPLVYSFTNSFGCTATDTMIASVITPTTANAGTGYPVCINNGAISLTSLGATPAGGTWSGRGVAGNSFDPAVAGLGPDTLTYSWGSGTCLTSDSTIMTVNAAPTVAVNNGNICSGQSVALTAGGAVTYTWSPNTDLSATTGTTVNANPTTSINYIVVGADNNNCTASAQAAVTVKPLPVVGAGNDTTFCNQPVAATLQGYWPTTGGTGTWSGSPQVTANGVFTPASTGSFTLYYTFDSTATGCSNADSIVVTVQPPVQAVAGPNDSICVGTAAGVLTGFSPPGGVWSGTGITNTATGFFDPAVAGVGVHTLQYSFGTGTCNTTSTKMRTVLAVPTYTFSPAVPVTCYRAPITLSVSGTSGYTWSPSVNLNTSTGNMVIATLDSTTVFTVYITNQYGCNDTLFLTVTVNPLPVVNAGPDTTLCDQSLIPLQLTGIPAGGNWTGQYVSNSGLFTASGTPAGVGIFTVTYHYTDGNSCTDSSHTHVNVTPVVFANAGPSDTFCLNSGAIQLLGFSPGTGGTWSGTGITNPSTGIFNTTVAGLGNHTLYYSYGSGSCASIDSTVEYVRAIPSANFSYVPACIGQATQFTDQSTFVTDNITGWYWNFGDGSFIRTQNPQHNYTTNANFNVTLTVTDNKGCSADTTISYQASPSPVVNFTAPTNGCIDTVISFQLPSVNAAQYNWTFGDGSTSNIAQPTHAYTASGNYTVKLVAQSANGCVDSFSSTISIGPAPEASFALSPRSGCGPLKVLYHYIPGQYPDLDFDFTWITGNGDTLFTALPDTVVYQPGQGPDTTYVVTLYVQSRACYQIAVHTDTVHVIKNPTANITASAVQSCPGLNINFNIAGLGDTFAINFGDGNSASISTPHPVSHAFSNATDKDTTYNVVLTSYSNCGTASDSVNITIHAGQVHAGITITPADNCINMPFTVKNASQGAAYTYYDLGTGTFNTTSNNSSGLNFSLPDSGQFNIKQLVYSADSCSTDMTTVQVNVHSPPVASFSDTSTSKTCTGNVDVMFTNLSTNATGYAWIFGDGQNSNDENPIHEFPDAGVYNVQLAASSQYGCVDTSTSALTLVHKMDGLYVPNAFSPTFGPEADRVFKPAGLCLDTYQIRIFDTWGELMWESTLLDNQQPAEGWDGVYKGSVLPQGVYVWKIEATFTDNTVWPGKDYNGTYKKIGTVTLLR